MRSNRQSELQPWQASYAALALYASREGRASFRPHLACTGADVFVGAFLGIAAQFVLRTGVIFYVLTWMWMGFELLYTARAIAEFDLTVRVLGLWLGQSVMTLVAQ